MLGIVTSLRDRAELFAVAARRLCNTLLEPPSEKEKAAERLLSELAHVYACALALDLGGDNYQEPDLDEVFPVSADTLALISANVGTIFGASCDYWFQFDPSFTGEPSPEPVVGDLADDFCDIYRDIAPALLAWEAGAERMDDILFEWRGTSFQTHWGLHALQALRALHLTCF